MTDLAGDGRPRPTGLAADVLAALALGATPRPRTWLQEVLADPALRRAGTPAPSLDPIRLALHALQADGWAVDDERRRGQWSVAPFAYAEAYACLLDRVEPERLRTVLAHADGYVSSLSPSVAAGRLPTLDAAIARLRLEVFTGASRERVEAVCTRLPFGVQDRESLFDRVLAEPLDEPLWPRLHPWWQADQLVLALHRLDASMSTGLALPPARVVALARALLADEPAVDASTLDTLRWGLAEHELRSRPADACDAAWARQVLALGSAATSIVAERPGLGEALRGAVLARQGDWAGADAAIESALAALRKSEGRRRGLLPAVVAEAWLLASLALGEPAALDRALKFCLAEGGSRQPNLDTPWGYVALAIRMRLGDVPRDLAPFRPARLGHPFHREAVLSVRVSPLDFWRWMMRAWLKDGTQPEPLPAAEADAAARLKAMFEAADQEARAEQVGAALQVLAGEPAPPWFFVATRRERWESALAALAAVATPAAAGGTTGGAAPVAESRLVWVLQVGPAGDLQDVVPHEQKRGARGWGAPKPVPLSRLRGAVAPAALDVPVLAALRPDEGGGRRWRLDLAAAASALVGHPFVAFAEAPERWVDLVEAGPTLDVVEEDDRLRVRLQPPLRLVRDEGRAGRAVLGEERQRELEALQALTIRRDGPQRARLVRFTPAQRRVGQLLGPDGLDIPRRGAAQLRQVLAGLGTHFEIHADEAVEAAAARDVPAESRLRAELQPEGPGLRVRLLAAPYGADHAADGPRLVPGRGRARLVATFDGETLGVQRDLGLERGHLESVLDACPMLLEPPADAPCEWVVESPDDALALVERLHQHHAVAALDWPQGRPVRVETAHLAQLALKVRTHEHWLAVDGALKVDEELVVSLQQLIAFGATSRSRFVPLGEGRYVALTQELRERIDDLAAVGEAAAAKAGDLAELRVPTVAAPWLQAALEGARTEYDAAFARRLRALDDARTVLPAVPSTLQATLRPYQEEGVEWALRLAHAGLGGCLADDMGLGKTLQSLAVLLARAGGGPALVVAPTSLMGNWRAEAARFAPSLRVAVYAEGGAPGERSAQVERQGKHDVLLVSYPMLQIDAEAFASRAWHTLVMDEAQAIKNAGAKRSQAVFALRAGFRLALSGTPIENRLGELWSIMNACNPGLLGTPVRFNERFANLIERQHDRHAQRTLRRLVAPFLLRRTKAEVLADLPPRTELVLKVAPGEAERAHYEALRREALVAAEKSLSGDAAGQAHLNILAGLTRLRRAACDPRLVSPKLKLPGAKVQAFGELAAELVANGHKALVFSQFVDFLQLLREPLDAAGIAYQTLDGSTPAAERTRRVDAFQAGEGDLFLISLKAGGFGLNLTVADYVVIADPWWNPAAEDQASGRAHRIGQQRPVTVYRLVAQGTLEERIVEMHQAKRELADSVLAADGSEGRALPQADELLALMRNDLQAPEIFG